MRRRNGLWSSGILLAVLALAPAAAHAQTPTAVTSASGVAFPPSTAQSATLLDGTPILSRYELRFLPGTACAPVAAVDLGKPTPDATNTIMVKPIPAFGTLTANCLYTAVVAAIGPGGEGVTPASDPFGRAVATAPAAPASKPGIVK